MRFSLKLMWPFLSIFILISLSPVPVQGDYAVAGYSTGYSNGITDFLVYKLAADGSMIWRKNFGGVNVDNGHSIRATSDNGLIVAGSSKTYSNGFHDFLVYKINSNGTKQWRKNYGGGEEDYLSTAIPTSDGGYLLFGETESYVHGSAGDVDFLVYKVNASGAKQWRKNYGGSQNDRVFSYFPTGDAAWQTSDGGYVFCGISYSYTHGADDFLIYKVNTAGGKQWRRNLGGSSYDNAYAIEQTPDGGYIVAGYTNSFTNGASDFLVYKLNSAGVKQWRKNYGGSSSDDALSVTQTTDGGYAIAGLTYSYGVNGDFLIYKVDASGAKQWRKNYGSAGWERGTHIIHTADGGYAICGWSDSITHGGPDFLVYKLNAAGQKQWRKNYGGTNTDNAFCITEVSE